LARSCSWSSTTRYSVAEPNQPGKIRQAAGKAQKSFGDAISDFRDAASSNPLATLAVIAGVGLIANSWSTRFATAPAVTEDDYRTPPGY